MRFLKQSGESVWKERGEVRPGDMSLQVWPPECCVAIEKRPDKSEYLDDRDRFGHLLVLLSRVCAAFRGFVPIAVPTDVVTAGTRMRDYNEDVHAIPKTPRPGERLRIAARGGPQSWPGLFFCTSLACVPAAENLRNAARERMASP